MNGISLQERFDPYPEAYLSTAIDGFPNWFNILGPNAGVGSGSLTKIIESIADYVLKCVRKMQKEGIGAMHVKQERLRDFCDYAESCKSTLQKQNASWRLMIGRLPEDCVYGRLHRLVPPRRSHHSFVAWEHIACSGNFAKSAMGGFQLRVHG